MADAASSAAASVSWIGVTAGLVSAAVTVATGLLLENYKRHCDRQAIAMAYLGEIHTLVTLSKSRSKIMLSVDIAVVASVGLTPSGGMRVRFD